MPLAPPSFFGMFMTNESSTWVDVLEPRRLLAGASLSNGLLTVNGTNSRDVVTIFIERKNPKNLDVKINGSVKAFTLTLILTSRFFGFFRSIKIVTTSRLLVPLTMSRRLLRDAPAQR